MSLVDYGSSDESDGAAELTETTGDAATPQCHDRPPPQLPALFHDLYQVEPRRGDDQSFHQGRVRTREHVSGDWPAHVYLDFWLPQHLARRFGDVLALADSQGLSTYHTLLVSPLGVERESHVSLSPAIMLPGDSKDVVRRQLLDIRAAKVRLDFGSFARFTNEEQTRQFLVLRLSRESCVALRGTCRAINAVLTQHELPTFEDTSVFHTSIAWKQPDHQDDAALLARLEAMLGQDLARYSLTVDVLKVKIGKDIDLVSLHHFFDQESRQGQWEPVAKAVSVVMYLSKKNLDNLKLYKYSSIDKSLLSKYVLKPYWSKFLLLFPTSMAPNLITLSGLSFVVINVLTLLYYDPGLEHGCPPWVYVSFAVGLWFYQSFDSIDGMQARRTGQSSPLGEMFDHGCDALNTTLEVIVTCSTINVHQSWWALTSQFASLCSFYLTTWEEYHTGTLYLSAFSGPVEGIVLVVGLHLVSAVYGPQVWDTRVLHALGLGDLDASLPAWLPLDGLELKHLFLATGILGLGFNILSASINVIRARQKKGEPLAPALAGLLPFFLSSGITFSFAYLNPNIVYRSCIPFMCFVGTCLAYSVGLMITAHVTHAEFPYFTPYFLLFPMIGAILFKDKVGPQEAVLVVWLSLGLSIGVYASFVVDVITDITHHLDIWCLSIKHPMPSKGTKRA